MQLFLNEKEKQRRVLKDYSIKLIDQLLMVVTAMTLTSYSLFALQAAKQHECLWEDIPYMMLTIPIVVYGVFRYMYLIQMKGLGGSPDEVLLHDRHIAWTVIVYIICIMLIRDF